MTNIEYSKVTEELGQLINKHFDNAYSFGNKLRIRIGSFDIICEPGVRMHFTKYIEEGELSQFAKVLRKELENARLAGICQYNNDRVIVMDFRTKKLIFEMFADGNVILVEGEKIIDAMRKEEWSDRKISRNEAYKFPKSNVKNTVKEAIGNAPEKYIIVALMQLPLGKEYALEILNKCGIEERKTAKALSKNDIEKIEVEFEKVKKQNNAYGFYQDGKIADYGILKFSKYEKLEAKEFGKLSEAIDEFYFFNKENKNEKIEKLKHRLEEQEKRLEKLKEEEAEVKKIADYIYQNYEEIEKILQTGKTEDINELEEKLKASKAKVDKKEKKIEIEFSAAGQ